MKDDTLKNYLLNKMSIIDRTGDDHWLFTPLSIAIDRIEELNKVKQELEVYKKALELLADDSTNTYLSEDKQDLIDYYLEKARKAE